MSGTIALKDTKRFRLANVEEDRSLLASLRADGLLSISTLVISAAAAEKFKTTTTSYFKLNDIQYSKAATDGLVFSAADTINTGGAVGSFWGAWLVQINAAGTVSTKSVGADQVYTTEALALADLPDVDAGNVSLGYISINASDDSSWTANTDDMTDGSDCATATFTDSALKTVDNITA